MIRATDVAAWLASFVFPPVCAGCGKMATKEACLCLDCREDASREPSSPSTPPGLDSIRCGPLVRDVTRALVHGLKYQGHRRAATDLVEIARSGVDADFCPPGAVLVPVPLHPHRRRERGYNQSALLAASWSRILTVPVREGFLERVIDTSTQTRLDAEKRRTNLVGAFRVGKEFQRGVPIVLVDDVLTTGATLSSCAAVLLAAGAPSVRAICVLWAGEA